MLVSHEEGTAASHGGLRTAQRSHTVSGLITVFHAVELQNWRRLAGAQPKVNSNLECPDDPRAWTVPSRAIAP